MTTRLFRIELLRPELGLWGGVLGGVLLLLSTVFMAAAEFAPPLPFVQLPASTSTGCHMGYRSPSDIGLSINESGRIYLDFYDLEAQQRIVESVAQESGVRFTTAHWQRINRLSYIGLPIRKLPAYLDVLEPERRRVVLPGVSIAELSAYIRAARREVRRQGNQSQHPQIIFRLDERLSTEKVRQVFRVFEHNGIHRFYLVTQLKTDNASY